MVKCLPAMWETWVRSLGQEDPLEKEMATHSSILFFSCHFNVRLKETATQHLRFHRKLHASAIRKL